MDLKKWYQSKTVWFNLLSFVIALAAVFGFGDFTPSADVTEATVAVIALVNVALRIWATVMQRVSREPLELDRPDNVDLLWVDAQRGGRSAEGCPGVIRLPFRQGTEPDRSASCGGKPAKSPASADDLF